MQTTRTFCSRTAIYGHMKWLKPIQVSSGHNGTPGQDQVTAATSSGRGNCRAAATDTLYLDIGHTATIVGTFSTN